MLQQRTDLFTCKNIVTSKSHVVTRLKYSIMCTLLIFYPWRNNCCHILWQLCVNDTVVTDFKQKLLVYKLLFKPPLRTPALKYFGSTQKNIDFKRLQYFLKDFNKFFFIIVNALFYVYNDILHNGLNNQYNSQVAKNFIVNFWQS